VALLQRGMAVDPNGWEYMQDIGFVYYWWLQDYPMAASWFDKASRPPGAPEWMKPLAAITLARGGDRASSRLLWRQIQDTTDVDWLKTTSQLRLSQLDCMDTIDGLKQDVARFVAMRGRNPRSWQELVVVEGLAGIPIDPTGVPFVLDPATGRIDLDRRSTLWPLPTNEPVPFSSLPPA